MIFTITFIIFVSMGTYCHAHTNHIEETIKMNKRSGTFLTYDFFKDSVILEYEEVAGQTERLSTTIRSLTDTLVTAYTQTEVDFTKKRPDLIANDFMLKSLAPFFESDVQTINWKSVETEIKNILNQFFIKTDWAKYSNSYDKNIFVRAIDKTNSQPIGVIQFLISPEFAENNIKAGLYGVIPLYQGKGLERLLMSSIYKLQSNIKRIFLHTRSTNTKAILRHKDWGFTEFSGKLPNWTDLEYLTEKSDILQKVSESLI